MTPLTTNPFLFTSGPKDAKVMLVGEAWGDEEQRAKKPFVGSAGKELDRMLFDAGLHRDNILCTNLVSEHPPRNDFTNYLSLNSEKTTSSFRGIKAKDPLINGFTELINLITKVEPQLIIGCGNWPLWALTNHTKISTQKGYKLPSGIMSWRGSQTYTEELPNGKQYPYLPIIHPAAILRDRSLRHITCQDLRARAARYANGSSSWNAPSFRFDYSAEFKSTVDMLNWWIGRVDRGANLLLCCDVETWKRRYLAVIGLADNEVALAIPFFYFLPSGELIDVFPFHQEVEICSLIRKLLSHPNTKITNQNYSYDYQFLNHYLGLTTTPTFDTMLAHHLLWPGTPKDLSYLASLYCNHYCYWKEESQDWDAKSSHFDLWKYNCKDTRSTYEITLALQSLLKKENLEELYCFQLEQWELAQELCQKGINFDQKEASKMRVELLVIASSLEALLISCMPEDLAYSASGKPWYSSNTQLQYIFYDRLGIPPVRHRKTKQPTLDKEAFELLKNKTPWLGFVFDKLKLLRSIKVFASTFLDVKLGRDGRLHPSFNVGGTETFRWSSSSNAFGEGMNLQNIPKMEEE